MSNNRRIVKQSEGDEYLPTTEAVRTTELRGRNAPRVPSETTSASLLADSLSKFTSGAVQAAGAIKRKSEQEAEKRGISRALEADEDTLRQSFETGPGSTVEALAYQKVAGMRLGDAEGINLESYYNNEFNFDSDDLPTVLAERRKELQKTYTGVSGAGFWETYDRKEKRIIDLHAKKNAARVQKEKDLNASFMMRDAIKEAQESGQSVVSYVYQSMKDQRDLVGISDEKQYELLMPILQEMAQKGDIESVEEISQLPLLNDSSRSISELPQYSVGIQKLKEIANHNHLETIRKESASGIAEIQFNAARKGLKTSEREDLEYFHESGVISTAKYQSIISNDLQNSYQSDKARVRKEIDVKAMPVYANILKNLESVTDKEIYSLYSKYPGFMSEKSTAELIARAHKAQNRPITGPKKKQLEDLFLSKFVNLEDNQGVTHTDMTKQLKAFEAKTGHKIFGGDSEKAFERMNELTETRLFAHYEKLEKRNPDNKEIKEYSRAMLDEHALRIAKRDGVVNKRIKNTLEDGAAAILSQDVLKLIESGDTSKIPKKLSDGLDTYKRLSARDSLDEYMSKETKEFYEIYDVMRSTGDSDSVALLSAIKYREADSSIRIPSKAIKETAANVVRDPGFIFDSKGGFSNQGEVEKEVAALMNAYHKGAGVRLDRTAQMASEKISRHYSVINDRLVKLGGITSPQGLKDFATKYIPEAQKSLSSALYGDHSESDFSFKFHNGRLLLVEALDGMPVLDKNGQAVVVSRGEIHDFAEAGKHKEIMTRLKSKEERKTYFEGLNNSLQEQVYSRLDSKFKVGLRQVMQAKKNEELP